MGARPLWASCLRPPSIWGVSVDGMKRLTPHSTWWHRLPHREHALKGARRRGPAMDHIGIDVHKKESQICILAEGDELLEQRIRTEPARFAAVLGARPRGRIVLESSTD